MVEHEVIKRVCYYRNPIDKIIYFRYQYSDGTQSKIDWTFYPSDVELKVLVEAARKIAGEKVRVDVRCWTKEFGEEVNSQ